MSIFSWLGFNRSPRKQAKWLYRRGMLRAKLGHNELAISDYTAVVQGEGVEPDLLAMALYNRALAHHAARDDDHAVQDLNAVLNVPTAAANIKTEARRKLVRFQRAKERTSPDA